MAADRAESGSLPLGRGGPLLPAGRRSRVECVIPSLGHGHGLRSSRAEEEFTRAVTSRPQAGLG